MGKPQGVNIMQKSELVTVKEYKLNDSYTIICKTVDYGNGSKKYNVIVSLTSVPFICYLEEYEIKDDANEANAIFKKMVKKYR